MPEESPKLPQSASPPVRTGAGDISERELSRERCSLNSTPTTRVQPAHPKKQLYSVPVNKFTARARAPSANLARLRSCLEEYRRPIRSAAVAHKAASMEDLTPTKRLKIEVCRKETEGSDSIARSPGLRSLAEEQAAARVGRFMLLAAWRCRTRELRCLRKTLEVQVSNSERLRAQVWALKSLLDSDNSKVRLAMRELERLKQLLRDKDREKAVLEKEKRALEGDVCAAEDRVSEMSVGLRNCRNELDAVVTSAKALERALALQHATAADLTSQRDRARESVARLEAELVRRESLLSSAEAEASALRAEADEKQRALDWTTQRLKMEHEALSRCESMRVRTSVRLARALRADAEARVERERLEANLALRTQQLAAAQRRWIPHPLLRMLEAGKSLLRHPSSFQEVFVWSLIPARHGC
ncbi:fibrinogen- and Ig-binding protein-like [Battus philenor]|uniref:fibrinogen- and Ig-binding protein-like n=1 Tax=Battus philenor TaxID=42288 RepID=UPI0035CF6F1D